MARRKPHEEHQNHEGWAIPYGDLVTLLLAFFVVMYSISQVNEGKYKVLSDSLNAAFRGEPSALAPIQVGANPATALIAPVVQLPEEIKANALRQLAQQAEQALGPLIQQGLVDVISGNGKITIAIRSDILFASGSATPSDAAVSVIRLLGEVLRGFPVSIKVEGHTDNVPVLGGQFASNWELSGGRAASVVRRLIETGVAPQRLSAVAFGEYQPVAPNATLDGRNANRRVVLMVEAEEPADDAAQESATAASPTAAAGAAAAGGPVPPGAMPVATLAPAAATSAAPALAPQP